MWLAQATDVGIQTTNLSSNQKTGIAAFIAAYFLFIIPVVSIVVSVIISLDIAKAFGKSEMFAFVGLVLFSLIGYLILGYGDAEYKATANNTPSYPTPQGPTLPPAATAM